MAVRTARNAVALAAATLLVAVASVLALPGVAQARDLNCRDFTYQEDAQAVLDADPNDPNRLDGLTEDQKDGVACESLPHKPVGGTTTTTTTTTPVATSATAIPANVVVTTTDTTSTTTGDTTTSSTTTSSTTTATTTSTTDSDSDDDSDSDSSGSDDSSSSRTSDDDRDCADFASQADAQAALDADLSDPDGIDADLDGIACEDRFGDSGQQVQVHPVGGVDTGGGPAGA
jgi:hypothetical protein